MKMSFIACIMAAALLCSAAALAQAPPEQGQPARGITPPKPAWLDYKNPYASEEGDLSNPHRTTDEIVILAQQTATDVLSFSPADYKDKLQSFKKYFVPQGWQLYAAYLKGSLPLSKVTDDGYSVGAIVSSPPEIVNNGPADGAYHWVVKVPVTISFFFSAAAADGSVRTGPSGKHILFMDMTRVASGGGDSGIAINNWRVDDAPNP